jgi:hypothetical protein
LNPRRKLGKRGRGIPALIALAAFAVLAGCGGGSSGSSSATFVADGNTICKEDNAKFKALGAPKTSDLRPYLAKLVPLEEEDLSKLKGLTPPSDKADTFDAWISDLEKGTETAKKAESAPTADAASKTLEANASINKALDAKARELGLDQCLTGAGSGSSSG